MFFFSPGLLATNLIIDHPLTGTLAVFRVARVIDLHYQCNRISQVEPLGNQLRKLQLLSPRPTVKNKLSSISVGTSTCLGLLKLVEKVVAVEVSLNAASAATTVSLWFATAKKSAWLSAALITRRRFVSPESTMTTVVSA
ncbi:hypothetical protein H5410_031686 [Solanum commersonii]|uniref:Uncharacterized protein n=1 Tax=Solanum commersonii TaxID=4109 RepID=A0A9J5YMG0_SOLCO|nr:hypothetical protein H5410_031686 [Solanum commersonii]